MMYLHRVIRIWPVLALAILIYVKMMPLVSGGPLFKSGFHGKEACINGWYWDLIFIQNYATQDVVSTFLMFAVGLCSQLLHFSVWISPGISLLICNSMFYPPFC